MSKSKLNYKVYNGKALKRIFENSRIFFLTILFAAGIIFGAVMIDNPSDLFSEVKQIAVSFVQNRAEKGIGENFFDSLKICMSFNILSVFFGFSLIGYPFIMWLPVLRGLGFGVLSGYMYSVYKLTGLGYCVLTVYPGAVVSVFAFLIACNDSCEYSKNAFAKAVKGRGQFEKGETKYFLTRQILFAAICILSSATDAVFTALFTGFFEI
ncbi:MAG: stage II sporulation protein M [Clostridia bacterium]|nr:stage II sporulation protein M [Clostridia bacterium]